MLVTDGEVKDGLLAILMRECELVAVCLDAIRESRAVLRQYPFIRALLAFGLRHRAVFIAPALITECSPFGMGRCHRHKYNWRENISPDSDLRAAAFDIDDSFIKAKSLLEVFAVKGLAIEMKAPAACFQESIIFIKPTALLDIEKYIAILHPNVHADIMTSTRH